MAEASLLEELNKDLPPGSRANAMPWCPFLHTWSRLNQTYRSHQSYHFHIVPLLEVGMWFAFWCRTNHNVQTLHVSTNVHVLSFGRGFPLSWFQFSLKFFMLPFLVPNPRPAWPNTSGSQPAAAKSMPWVPSAAPSLPCAKANGGHKWRDVKGTKKNPLVFACFCIMFLSLQHVSSFMKLS